MQNTRNKLVFCKNRIEGLYYVDVGKELSLLLGNGSNLPTGFETMYKQVLNQSSINNLIGRYLAIENIGIIFESELKIDIKSMFDRYSKDQSFIILSDALIENNYFYYLTKEDQKEINLNGLSYKIAI